MNTDDRRAIEGLFGRLSDAERNGPQRDGEAERLIADSIRRQPAAPYYLAQTVLVQEHALEVAEERIRDLERQVAEARRAPPVPERPRGPWDRDERQSEQRQGGGGGGFLAGAAQTAMGVAGGVLLGSAISSLFGGGHAQAAEPQAEPQPEPEADPGADADMGGDDFGGFDMGGDF
jgi:hypothetical protein